VSYSNELHDALLRKPGKDFWRVWNSKFNNNRNIPQVDGISDNKIIAENFAKHFEKICTPFSSARNDELKAKFDDRKYMYCGSYISDDCMFTTELISSILSKMKNGKAPGLDDISCEHLKYCHPIISMIICKLFNMIIATGHVPLAFGRSYTVPIPG